ncbi:MAG: hypothetical protein M3P85_01180 [Actinomycetota bacterium]|nr:hypothetical protein [Actinomycetota bacterium]
MGRHPKRLLAAAREVLGRRCTTHTLDVTDHTAVPEQLEQVLAAGRLAVLVWATGIFDWAPADEADPEGLGRRCCR